MSRFLLDTNIILLGAANSKRIPRRMFAALDSGEITFSVISYWEIVLKTGKGRLEVGDPRLWWVDAVDRFGATVLPLRAAHIDETQRLPPVHLDPFDRALIGQAVAEELTLVTLDATIAKYKVRGLHLITAR